MAEEDNIKGLGERYSFLGMDSLEEDLLRSEFGSVWSNPWDSSWWTSWKPDEPPSFGQEAEDPRFEIEFGPIVETTAEFAPYTVNHQSVKLKAKSSVYLDDCIDCGFHADAAAVLAGSAISADWALYWTPFDVLSTIVPGEYTSMGELAGGLQDILGNERAHLYSDCSHSFNTPLNEEDISLAAYSEAKNKIDLAAPNGTVIFEYGDFIEKLEEVILNLDEIEIPNLYLLLSAMTYSQIRTPDSPFFRQAIEYLHGIFNCEFAETIKEVSTGFTDFLVSAESVESLSFWNAYKNHFSLRAEVNFSVSQSEGEVADNLKDTNLDCRLLRWMTEKWPEADRVSTGATFERLQDNTTSLSLVPHLSNGALNIRTYDLFRFSGTLEFPGEIQLMDWAPPSSMAFIGDDLSSEQAAMHSLSDSNWLQRLALLANPILFSNHLAQRLSSHNRTYQQVFNGRTPRSETIAYKISKYKKSTFSTTDQLEIVQSIIENDTQAIQNVWLSNSSETEAIEYIDTQIKYKENYVFVIWAYNFVAGTRYVYSNFRTSESPSVIPDIEVIDPVYDETMLYFMGVSTSSELESTGWNLGEIKMPDEEESDFYQFTTSESLTLDVDDDCEVAFVASTIPMAIIKEVPFFVWQGSVMDMPPAVPDVNIIPYCGNDSDLLILLNPTAGTTQAEPIIINASEQAIFDDIKTSQALYNGLVEFGTDNPIDGYEVYRTTELPSSYSDFAGNLLTTVSTIYDEAMNKKANAASYLDSVEPNTKYYYVFRSIDIHGHFSKPTSVFEVELLNDDGIIVPSISVIEMVEEKLTDDSKSFKAVMHVVPKITQAVVNEADSSLDGLSANIFGDSKKPALGVEDETLWGKTFKIRLVSRKTKRKFDINVTFGTEHVKGENIPPVSCPDFTYSKDVEGSYVGDPVEGTGIASTDDSSGEPVTEGVRGSPPADSRKRGTTRGTLSDGPGQDRGPGRTRAPDDDRGGLSKFDSLAKGTGATHGS